MDIPRENSARLNGMRKRAIDLRSKGWSYTEIATTLGSPRSTVVSWCRTVLLSGEQRAAIRRRTGSREGIPRDTQRRRREEIRAIRRSAALSAGDLVSNPLWVAGTVLYWGEGAKTSNELRLSNADPAALRLYIQWVNRFHPDVPGFRAVLNIHSDNDALAATSHWARELGLAVTDFTRPYRKPDGTGHRKNHLPNGVCSVRARRSTDAFHRTMAWIEALPGCLPACASG